MKVTNYSDHLDPKPEHTHAHTKKKQRFPEIPDQLAAQRLPQHVTQQIYIKRG